MELRGKVIRIAISPIIDEIGEAAARWGCFPYHPAGAAGAHPRGLCGHMSSHEMRTPLTAVRALIGPSRRHGHRRGGAHALLEIILRELCGFPG